MGRIWAVARYTLSQCLRTKIAAVFAVLLIAALVTLPLALEGDGTLAGRIRTFLAYGASATSILLTLVTIFLSVALVAGDVQAKHIFLLAVKPVARWQYIVGRWAGVVMLDAILLAGASAAIYGTAQYLRTGKAVNREDRLAVENEVFASRDQLLPQPMREIENDWVAEQMKRIGPEKLKEAVQAYRKESGLTEAQARAKVEEDVRGRVREAMQSVPPRGALVWRFTNVVSVGRGVRGTGKVITHAKLFRLGIRVDRGLIRELAGASGLSVEGVKLPGLEATTERIFVTYDPSQDTAGRLGNLGIGGAVNLEATLDKGRTRSARGQIESREPVLLVRIEGDPKLAEGLIQNSYVAVNGVNARVEAVRGRQFLARFLPGESERAEPVAARRGAEVDVMMHPTVQLAYKITPGANVPGGTVPGRWSAGSPDSGAPPDVQDRGDPVDLPTKLSIPDRVLGKSGDLLVEYRNLSPFVLSILHKDVSLFCRVGSFDRNFVRTMSLVLAQLMFLAGLGVFAGSFLSFPIGCLLVFATLPFSLGRAFLADAVRWTGSGGASPIVLVGRGAMAIMTVFLPDFGKTSAGNRLADALNVSWGLLGETFLVTVAWRTGLVLLCACLIFRKRELARVQV